MNTDTCPLGRREPTDWRHVEKYPLTAIPAEAWPTGVPSVIGIPWYTEFDRPVQGKDGRWRVATDGHLTTVRGAHAICVPPKGFNDLPAWWRFYDQPGEDCVGFSESRVMTLLNRKRYAATWLYDQAQLVDEWEDTPPAGGTSVRAGLDVLRKVGHRRVTWAGNAKPPDPAEGIAANRWATDINDWLTVTGWADATEVPWLQSWGMYYPHVVWVPAEVHARLMGQNSEYGLVTDR